MSLKKIITTGLFIAIGIILSQLLSFYYPPSTTIIKFGIGYVPLIILSLIYGKELGFIAAIIQDLLGYFMFGVGHGPFYLGFTVNACFYGFLPGFINQFISKYKRNVSVTINHVIVILFFLMTLLYLFDIEAISKNTNFNDGYRYLLVGSALFSSAILLFFEHYILKKRPEEKDFHLIFLIVLVLYILTSLILTPIWLFDLYHISIWAQLPLRIVKMPVEVLVYTVIVDKLYRVLKDYHYE